MFLRVLRAFVVRLLFFGSLACAALTAGAAGFDLVDTSGKHHRLADYQGRFVVLNYWATWCVPCVQEIPEIAAFQREHRDVVVIGIAVDAQDVPKTQRFAAKVGLDYPLVISNAKVEKQLGEPKGLPTTRIYDPTGKLVFNRLGRVTRKDLEGVTGTSARATPS